MHIIVFVFYYLLLFSYICSPYRFSKCLSERFVRLLCSSPVTFEINEFRDG